LFAGASALESLGVEVIPRMLIIGKKSFVRSDFVGYVANSQQFLRSSIQQLLPEK
jgi:hypothetical protein